jgi:flavin reductase (DIM6/NTAB) family NADH-FMN oxidoreductase RutF
VVFGEVVGIHIKDEALTDGLFDIVKAGTVSRLGYREYASSPRHSR